MIFNQLIANLKIELDHQKCDKINRIKCLHVELKQ